MDSQVVTLAHGFFGPSPNPDVEYRLAFRLLGAQGNLDRRILGALVGRPQRFGELKRVLDGRKDTDLTQSLARLQKQGLVRMRIRARRSPSTKLYELTALGSVVIFRIAEMSLAHSSANALKRGAAADVA